MGRPWRNPKYDDEQHIGIMGFGAASPGYWANVARRQWERICEVRDAYRAIIETARATGEPIQRVDGQDPRLSFPGLMEQDAHYLIIAADFVLTLYGRYQELLPGNAALTAARANFDASGCSDVAYLRDTLAHVDAYQIGTGWKSQNKEAWEGPFLEVQADFSLLYKDVRYSVDLETLVEQVSELADVADQAWWDRPR